MTLMVVFLQFPTSPPHHTIIPHSTSAPRHGPHPTPVYENQPPPLALHSRQRPPTIHEEDIDAPLHQMHHHNVMDPVFTTMPATQQAIISQSPNTIYQQQGVTMPAAIGQHATPYRHQEDKDKTHHDASPHAFSPPDGSHPQLRSWYSHDSSYTSESLLQMQQDAAKQSETQGLPRAKRGLSPSESLPLNFKRDDDSDEEEENVTREIREIAGEIIEETSGNRTIKTNIHKPLDPNLVCPTCKKQFRIGEIQKLRRHAKECDKRFH